MLGSRTVIRNGEQSSTEKTSLPEIWRQRMCRVGKTGRIERIYLGILLCFAREGF